MSDVVLAHPHQESDTDRIGYGALVGAGGGAQGGAEADKPSFRVHHQCGDLELAGSHDWPLLVRHS